MNESINVILRMFDGSLTEQELAEAREQLKDPQSGLNQMFELAAAIARDPFAIDWSALADASEDESKDETEAEDEPN